MKRSRWFHLAKDEFPVRAGAYNTSADVRTARRGSSSYRWFEAGKWGRCVNSPAEASASRAPSPIQPSAIIWRGIIPKEKKR